MRISDWSSDVCSSDLHDVPVAVQDHAAIHAQRTLKERVALTLGSGGRFLDVKPLAGAGVRTQVVFLERVHDAREGFVAVDLAGLKYRNVGRTAALAGHLGFGPVDHAQRERVISTYAGRVGKEWGRTCKA